ncbi:MAG TPA: phosphoribosyltransferase family protein [Ilumatobacteraceae bacterium]|nr:phosphoribosyltransferase family protein [Ilumatobacteraceae bacterium]
MARTFRDRSDAGRALAAKLQHLRDAGVVVLALPRGGVPVAYEVARELDAPLDVIVVRKVGVPGQPELAMGAIGEDGVRVVNDEIVRLVGATAADFSRIERVEREELQRRAERFRGTAPRADLAGRVAVIVDDGIATGSTARAACHVARAHGADRVVLAVPVAAPDSVRSLAGDADEIVCVEQPTWLRSVGQWYDDFTQVDDHEVVDLLERAHRLHPPTGSDTGSGPGSDPGSGTGFDAEVEVGIGGFSLPGHLTIPADAVGVVVFAHGSGSSRHSPRNQFVADQLQAAGLGTLTFDLLTDAEAADRRNVFDIGLLGSRLLRATDWVRDHPAVAGLPIALFGASTGAAAALVAASDPSRPVAAVVSRGGRPDLAGNRLDHVHAPTLLIVGGADTTVLLLNQQAQRELRCENQLTVVPGATHLFEEPGTLEQVAELAADWFVQHCRSDR